MSEEIKNIQNIVMDKIHHENIKMRPRIYFIMGSILLFLGSVLSVVSAMLLTGLIRFSLRHRGTGSGYRIDQFLDTFPWWAPIFAILTVVLGIWLIKHYDFSYKKNFVWLLLSFIGAVIIGGWFIDSMGLNDALANRGPAKGLMRKYMRDHNLTPTPGMRRSFETIR